MWQRVPSAYAACPLYSDAWLAYPAVLPPHQHHIVGKETGETAHQERWYNPAHLAANPTVSPAAFTLCAAPSSRLSTPGNVVNFAAIAIACI